MGIRTQGTETLCLWREPWMSAQYDGKNAWSALTQGPICLQVCILKHASHFIKFYCMTNAHLGTICACHVCEGVHKQLDITSLGIKPVEKQRFSSILTQLKLLSTVEGAPVRDVCSSSCYERCSSRTLLSLHNCILLNMFLDAFMTPHCGVLCVP